MRSGLNHRICRCVALSLLAVLALAGTTLATEADAQKGSISEKKKADEKPAPTPAAEESKKTVPSDSVEPICSSTEDGAVNCEPSAGVTVNTLEDFYRGLFLPAPVMASSEPSPPKIRWQETAVKSP